MSESSEPQPVPAPTPAPRASSWKFTIALSLLLIAAAGGWYAYVSKTTVPTTPPADELGGLKLYIAQLATTQKLADGYADENGDLVADPPKDAAKFLKVEELTFSLVGGEDVEKAQLQWKDFMAALEKGTGKKVKYLADVNNVTDQTKALAEGRLHVTAFNTGQVPTAVNTAGFVPLFCPADKGGKYAYQMSILVRADSPIQKPEELRGKTIGLVALSSNSGGKAPLVLLKDKFSLLPGRDYKYTLTGDHVRSVKELLAGQHAAVCVANDLLARLVGTGEVKSEQFRTIYTSESFPPLCFGTPHNLPPELLAGVKRVFTEFSFDGTTVGELYKSRGQSRFAPVDYKADWKLTREVDERLSHLLDSK